jgi:hypothetical protein
MTLLAIVVVAIAATLITIAGALIVRRVANRAARSAVVVLVAIALIATPFVLECVVARLFRRPHILWMDLRLPNLIAPVALAVLSASPIILRGSQASLRVVLGLWAWAAFWGVFNTLNKCSPGWCGSYGFPLPFFSWSDAVVTFNDQTSPEPFSSIAFAIDVAVLISPFVIASRKMVRNV